MADPLQKIAAAYRAQPSTRGPVRATLVHEPARTPDPTRAVVPGVEAVRWPAFVADLTAPGRA